MNYLDALEIVAARNPRYRELCAEDHPDRWARDGYRRLVVRLASTEGATGRRAADRAAPDWRETRRYIRLAEACPLRTKEPGCCTGYLSSCDRAHHGRVTQFDCIACMRDAEPTASP